MVLLLAAVLDAVLSIVILSYGLLRFNGKTVPILCQVKFFRRLYLSPFLLHYG